MRQCTGPCCHTIASAEAPSTPIVGQYDYWTTAAGQEELLRRVQEQRTPFQSSSDPSLNVFEYTEKTKSMLSAATLLGGWEMIEMTADTGACDTVIPKKMCEHIPIVPSLQSMREMEYEVANGQSIPNLGERRCFMWTESATEAKAISMQVADVHKALLSLSRCADMGYESRFGRKAGCLICEKTGEVIPLIRRGNLYILRAWVRAAPFHRPE